MIDAIASRIEHEISNIKFPVELPELYNPIEYTLSNGGKRLRPLLLLLSTGLFDPKWDKAINQALAVEIFHNFTLVHDDIMDNAPLRRGKETVFKKWNQNIAILSGDVMFSYAFQYLSMGAEMHLSEMLNTFTEMATKVCEGQQMDMNFEHREPTLNAYLKMIELKTAFLIGGSMKIGAIMGGATTPQQDAMFSFGLKIGTAFQLMDDLLDVFGDPGKVGKQVGGDIISNKKTILYLQCLEFMQDEEKREFTKIYNDNSVDSTEKVNKVQAVYNDKKVQDQVKIRMEGLIEEAEKTISGLVVNSDSKNELINLSRQLTHRKK